MKKLLWILPGLCLWADDTALLSVQIGRAHV